MRLANFDDLVSPVPWAFLHNQDPSRRAPWPECDRRRRGISIHRPGGWYCERLDPLQHVLFRELGAVDPRVGESSPGLLAAYAGPCIRNVSQTRGFSRVLRVNNRLSFIRGLKQQGRGPFDRFKRTALKETGSASGQAPSQLSGIFLSFRCRTCATSGAWWCFRAESGHTKRGRAEPPSIGRERCIRATALNEDRAWGPKIDVLGPFFVPASTIREFVRDW